MATLTAQAAPPRTVLFGTAAHPLGKLLVGVTEDGQLCRTSFLRGRKPAEVALEWQHQWPATTFRPHKISAAYAKHPMLMVGTELQRQICEKILEIPPGTVASYGQVADMLDLPGRARAVGRACKMCHLAPVIPCHRIIAAHGLGGYGPDGLAFKQKLLKAEGLTIALGTRRA